LVYLSDIPGVLKEGQVIDYLDQERIEAEIAAGVISGGMIPKVEGSLAAVNQGVGSVVIGAFENLGDLRAFIAKQRGTRIII
jgi:acetylglutamate kinase